MVDFEDVCGENNACALSGVACFFMGVTELWLLLTAHCGVTLISLKTLKKVVTVQFFVPI